MGARQTEDQMADELAENPALGQMMTAALSNPLFIEMMIQSNPMLANLPNAREILQSPYVREMMTNPESLRLAGRMRQAMGGASAVAPGVTDFTPPSAGAQDGAAAGANTNATPDPLRLLGLFPPPGSAGAAVGPGANPFAALLGAAAPAAAAPQNPSTSPTAAQTPGQAGGSAQQPPINPFGSLFGNLGAAGAAPGAGAPGNPLDGLNLESLQQFAQMMGLPGPGAAGATAAAAAAAAPPDNRPPEERYAEQLRQLNDMGFFDFDSNVAALRRSGGSVQGAIEHLLGGA